MVCYKFELLTVSPTGNPEVCALNGCDDYHRNAVMIYCRPILEHCTPVWSPYLTSDIQTVGKCQKSSVLVAFHKVHHGHINQIKLPAQKSSPRIIGTLQGHISTDSMAQNCMSLSGYCNLPFLTRDVDITSGSPTSIAPQCSA